MSLATWTHENLKKSNHLFFEKIYSQNKVENDLEQMIIKIYKEKSNIKSYLT